MSQEKAQLIAPIGIMTVTGMTATGVITATSFTGNIVGSAKSLVNGTDVTAGVVTATSFVGNLTGNIQRLADSAPNINVGVTTATSFVGNLTGSVTDLTSAPAITVGLVTATGLEGNITGNVTGDVDGDVTGNVTGTIAGNVTGNVTGNATGLAGGLGVNYNGGWTGAGTSQVRAGVITATYFHGDGSNLDGVSSGPVSQQAVTIDGAATSIDLSNGNLIYATQSASTTVSFANTENGNVYFVRTKDDNTTARTITWPDRIKWEGGSAPTLIQDNPRSTDAQVFLLVTRDMGVTWYGKEVVSFDPLTFTLFSWGQNQDGALGLNDNVKRSSPTQLTGTNWNTFSSSSFGYGSQSVFSKKSDGSLWSWGAGTYGSGGRNSTTQVSKPIQIGTDITWAWVWSSYQNGYATKTDGTLWGWGGNGDGQLGLNTRGDSTRTSSPVQIGTSTDWSTANNCIGGARGAIGAIKTDGTLWTWGENNNGELGHNQKEVKYSSPTQLPGTTWRTVTGGRDALFATKTDGTLWSWGGLFHGGLGHNQGGSSPLGYYSSPTQVGTDTTWRSLVSSSYQGHTLASKTDGTLWCWGGAGRGCTGHNDEIQRSSPTQIGTGTDWSNDSCLSRYSGAAIKTDGTLYAWGSNTYGRLGQNNTIQRSSPTQIPGTWSRITPTGGYESGFMATQLSN